MGLEESTQWLSNLLIMFYVLTLVMNMKAHFMISEVKNILYVG